MIGRFWSTLFCHRGSYGSSAPGNGRHVFNEASQAQDEGLHLGRNGKVKRQEKLTLGE